MSSLAALALVVVLGVATFPESSVAAPPAQDDGPRIDAPASGAHVSGHVEIRGRAVTPDPVRFQFYRLYYGRGAEASSLRPIGPAVDQPVEDGLLGTWDAAMVTPGEYLILLIVYDAANRTTNAEAVVTVDPPPTPSALPTQAPLVVVTPGELPTPGPDEEASPPTPILELPQLDPNIPQVDIPPPAPEPAVPNIVPIAPDGGAQPIQPFVPHSVPTPFEFPPPQAPSSASEALEPVTIPSGSSLDPGSSGAPSISAPVPPAPPAIRPYEPPTSVPTAPLPTPFGLPPG